MRVIQGKNRTISFIITLCLFSLSLTNDENDEFGLIIFKYSFEQDIFTCYLRKQMSDDELEWFAKLDIKTGSCKNDSPLDVCLKIAANICGWTINKSSNIIVQYIYSLDYTTNYTTEEFGFFFKVDTKNVTPITNLHIHIKNSIKINEKSSGLVDYLQYNYKFKQSWLDMKPIMVLSLERLSMGIPILESNLHGSLPVKTFSLRNQQYRAFVNDFYCLGLFKIIYATYFEAYKEQLKSTLYIQQPIFHPCVVAGIEDIVDSNDMDGSCINKYLVNFKVLFGGRPNLEACISLIKKVIHKKNICEENTHCNFSNLNQEMLEGISHFQIYNDHFNTPRQLKSGLLEMLLQHRELICIELLDYFQDGQSDEIFIECFTLHIIYTILLDPSLIKKEVEISLIKKANLNENSNSPLIFFDPWYGSIVEAEEEISITGIESHKISSTGSSVISSLISSVSDEEFTTTTSYSSSVVTDESVEEFESSFISSLISSVSEEEFTTTSYTSTDISSVSDLELTSSIISSDTPIITSETTIVGRTESEMNLTIPRRNTPLYKDAVLVWSIIILAFLCITVFIVALKKWCRASNPNLVDNL